MSEYRTLRLFVGKNAMIGFPSGCAARKGAWAGSELLKHSFSHGITGRFTGKDILRLLPDETDPIFDWNSVGDSSVCSREYPLRWLQGCLSDSFTRKFNQQNQITINCHPFLQVGLFSTRQKSDLPERSNFNPDRQINPYATI